MSMASHPAPAEPRKKRSKVEIVAYWMIALATAAGAAVWLIATASHIPSASIADFVLALSAKVDALERGQWGVAALWLIEPFGGHIVTYTRALQLANYMLADYSPDFVRLSGIAALALAFVSVAWLGFRVLGRTLPAALIFTLGAWLIASPTIYVLLAWPDSLVPYYSVLIVACVLLPLAAEVFASEASLARKAAWGLFCCVAIVIGSGAGWSALVVIPVLYALSAGHVDRLRARLGWRTLLVVAVAAPAVLFAIQWLGVRLLRTYETALVLDEARHGLELATQHLDVVAKYFFASLASGFVLGSIDETWLVGLAPFIVFAGLLLWTHLARRSRDDAVWIALGLLGLGSIALTTLARWHFVIERGMTMAPQYYSVFAIPFYLGLGGLLLSAVARGRRTVQVTAACLGVGMVGFGMYAIHDRSVEYRDALAARVALAGASVEGMANRNLLLSAELTGVPNFVAKYQLDIVPRFQRNGKYRSLTDKFISSPAAFMRTYGVRDGPDLRISSGDCAENGRLMSVGADARKPWTDGPWAKINFVRFVGVAGDPTACSSPAAFVVALDENSRILCVSRPSRVNDLTIPAQFRQTSRETVALGFDFSCPIDRVIKTGESFTVASFSPKTRSFVVLPFDDTPADFVRLSGTVEQGAGEESLRIGAVSVPISDVRAGWTFDTAGREEGGRVILDGWAYDRVNNRTADLIIVVVDDKIAYAAEPRVPFPSVEAGVTLVGDRRAGFSISVPKAWVVGPEGKPRRVRIFAMAGKTAALELNYQPTFPLL